MISNHPEIRLEKPRSVQVQITEQLRGQIRSGKWVDGYRLPPTKTLAAHWGTEATTVHRAMAALVKEGLLDRTPRRGTFVRQRAEKLTCVGVYDVAGSFRQSLFGQALQAALKEELAAAGMEMDVWLDPRPTAEQGQPWMPLVKAAEHREFQALIATVTDWPHLDWQRRLPVPTAFSTVANIPSEVGLDVAQFAELSVEALARQGCRSVGIIATQPSTETTNPDGSRHVSAEFYERLMDRVSELGLTVKNDWMRAPTVTDSDQEQFGYRAFLQLWSQPEKPAGLIVWPDTAARGVVLGLREKQVRVPEELKLVLHKNEAVNLLCPMPATLLVSSERAIARGLIEQVQKQFRGESCDPVHLPFRLMAHNGVAARPTNQRKKGVGYERNVRRE